jgi:hypothetical protein
MKDALVFKLDNTHYINPFSDDISMCMFPFSHCLLIADYSFAICFDYSRTWYYA